MHQTLSHESAVGSHEQGDSAIPLPAVLHKPRFSEQRAPRRFETGSQKPSESRSSIKVLTRLLRVRQCDSTAGLTFLELLEDTFLQCNFYLERL